MSTGAGGRPEVSDAVEADAFERLLVLAGLDPRDERPLRESSLTPTQATQLLAALLKKPVTAGNFPPRMGASLLLREVMEGGTVSREDLLHRLARLHRAVVLRPDGYLAWVISGRTQQRVAAVEWKDGVFAALGFELGRFYLDTGGVFRPADAQLQPVFSSFVVEVYDDADVIGRSLDGAEDALAGLYHAVGQVLSRPLDSLFALQHLPAGVAALIASSPAYWERFQSMTVGEQIREVSRLTTQLLLAGGTTAASTRALTGWVAGAEATVPVLSLSASGALGMEAVAVPVGRVATMMGGGAGAAIILHEPGRSGTGGPGQMRPSAEELLQQSTQRPPERLSGFRIFGNKGLVGSTFQRNILLIEAEAKGAAPLRRLISEFEAEARAAGASRLSITGHAVINQGFLSPALAERFGFQLRRINKDTIELVKELTR
ncbi:hypothetical protein [Corallococcus sicarius]|uniref:Uncharacterized protein n=1 Tax=Corallococcus sicarius TaxID=2316726 RepID=A0A3A8N6D8_9BACT|nr:hypothetical protein [Corallococcus sicarius]RKH37821.1 hypothetical protein D7X12_28295 [Corallococcus sicarius]